jgi:hypothetical protein
MISINATPSYLFRKISNQDEGLPTLLYDEIDTGFGPKARENEEVRGILNAGHRRGAKAGRCLIISNKVTTEDLPAYCAVALAGLGSLPDSIRTRSIVIRMRRRNVSERVEPFRRRLHENEGYLIRDRLSDWAQKFRAQPELKFPDLPLEVSDRNADVWESLVMLADFAGETWGAQSRTAAIEFTSISAAMSPSLGIQLLEDLKLIYEYADQLPTDTIIKRLIALPERPWSSLQGESLSPRKLSQELKEYGVKSTAIRIGDRVLRGYRRRDLHDPWNRYITPAPSEVATSVTYATLDEVEFDQAPVSDVALVTSFSETSNTAFNQKNEIGVDV